MSIDFSMTLSMMHLLAGLHETAYVSLCHDFLVSYMCFLYNERRMSHIIHLRHEREGEEYDTD